MPSCFFYLVCSSRSCFAPLFYGFGDVDRRDALRRPRLIPSRVSHGQTGSAAPFTRFFKTRRGVGERGRAAGGGVGVRNPSVGSGDGEEAAFRRWREDEARRFCCVWMCVICECLGCHLGVLPLPRMTEWRACVDIVQMWTCSCGVLGLVLGTLCVFVIIVISIIIMWEIIGHSCVAFCERFSPTPPPAPPPRPPARSPTLPRRGERKKTSQNDLSRLAPRLFFRVHAVEMFSELWLFICRVFVACARDGWHRKAREHGGAARNKQGGGRRAVHVG